MQMRNLTQKDIADFVELISPPVLFVNNPFALVAQNTNTNTNTSINTNMNMNTNTNANEKPHTKRYS